MLEFKNKVAVITGAGSGIGKALAREAAGRGMKLVLADIDLGAIEQTYAEVTALGAQALAVRCDVSRADQVEELAAKTLAQFGVVHLVINNAGVSTHGLLWENSDADWQWTLGVNLFGVVHGTRVFTRAMLDCARHDPDFAGHIVNTASVAGFLTPPLMGTYNTSKHAVVGLTETLFHDLRLAGAPIGVTMVCPGFLPTGIAHAERNRPPGLARAHAPSASQQAAQSIVEAMVAGGSGTAADVASLTFKAIEEDRFYVFTHQELLPWVEDHTAEMLMQGVPRDPFKATPEASAMFRQAARA